MSSINASKRSCKHPYEKSISPVSNNISLDESDLSLHTHETSIPGNSYTNTSSPLSSTSTTSIIRHPRRRLSKVRLKGKQTFFFSSLSINLKQTNVRFSNNFLKVLYSQLCRRRNVAIDMRNYFIILIHSIDNISSQ